MSSKKKQDNDERFALVQKDPRFWEMPEKEQKIKIDKRFQSMFHDKRFKVKYTVDKRGRPISHSSTEDLKRFYKLSDSEEEEEEGLRASEEKKKKVKPESKEKKGKAGQEVGVKGVRVTEEGDGDDDEQPSAEEDADLEDDGSEGSEEDDDTDKESMEADGSEESSLDSGEDSDSEPDLARGRGNVETSSDEDDDDYVDAILKKEEEDIEHDWGELCKDAQRNEEVSARLAVCNMDWDRIKAKDLLVLFSSFVPKGGAVLSVRIFPSEFGKERLKVEETQGPPELKVLPDESEDDTEEERVYREKLRDYQFKRLKYFYAVLECDSVDTAVRIYDECDGFEYESSCSVLDLRFIPDDVTFDDDPKDVATDTSVAAYTPKLFSSSATSTSKVKLTWDETDHERVTALSRKFDKNELLDMDFKAYLASSSEEGEDEEAGAEEEIVKEVEVKPVKEKKKKKSEEQIRKYRELLKSVQSNEKKLEEDKGMEMEITWVPGLKETTEKLVKKKLEATDKLTPWEGFLQKKKEKKKQKSSERKQEAADDEFSDDELPPDVDLRDPFFTEELSASGDRTDVKKKRKDKKKKREEAEEDEELEKRKAEMALLMEDDVDETKHKHFNYEKIVEQQNLSKKKRKKLMKDSLHLANMLRRFTREKEEMRKKNLAVAGAPPRLNAKVPSANSSLINAHPKAAGNESNVVDVTTDQAVLSLLSSANNDVLQDMMGDLDFAMLDSPQPASPAQGENSSFGAGQKAGGGGRMLQANVMTPPPLPSGLPGPLTKRIEDLRAASRSFDEEGRKKFFTLDMNNILLDIELQVQEQPAQVRSAVYSHLEAFVPCNKEALLKRLKKLSLNVQDDRLRTPLLKLKLAVCSVMPEQIARYNMDCIAKVAKQQSEEGDKNGSEDEDEEKPGKRVMGPRKKFIWDDKLRLLLCNLVQVKLSFYKLEGKSSLSLEDYLKAFMETEVKPLWPKGWMQARMLFKESTMVHGHLTGYTVKKKMIPTPKAKPKEVAWVPRPVPSAGLTPSPAAQVTKRPPSPSEPICLDSLDDAPSLDSISQALAILGNAAKGLAQGDSPPSPEKPKTSTPTMHGSPLLQQQRKNSVGTPASNTPHYISTSLSSSPALSRSAPSTSSPLTSVRAEVMGAVKGGVQTHRHPVLNTQRPLSVGVVKTSIPASASSPKPRPPPTASPLMAPGSKMGTSASPSVLLKGSNNKASSGDALVITSPQTRPHPLTSTSVVIPKTFPTSRLAQTPQSKAVPSPQTLSGVQTQPQSNFITPMHATLTKSTHSSIPPIVKLTPRTLNPIVATTAAASPSASQSPRSQAATPLHQYTPKTPAAYRPPFSGGGATKSAQSSYTPPSSQKTPTTTSLINTLPMSKHSGTSAPPNTASPASAGQRQRPGGGSPQVAKPVVSVPLSQVSTTGSSSLLSSAPSLPLGFGMLGGLVSLPFQFPPMLNLSQLGSGGSSPATSSSAASSSAAFSTLTQNVSQSQGGDAKRKTL